MALTTVLRWMPLGGLVLALVACERPPRDPSDYYSQNEYGEYGECPEGAQWDGVRCVRTEVACPDGSSFEFGKCVANPAATTSIDPLAGIYAVSGTRPDGSSYKGTVSLSAVAMGGPYKLTWTIAGATFSGVGSKRADILSVGWSSEGDDHGVVDFVATGDGELDGVWFDSASKAPGRELLVGGQSSLAGIYKIKKGQSPAGAKYTGTCDLAVLNGLHYLSWHVGKDTFRGLGIREGDVLSVGFSTSPTSNFGVVQYKIDGDRLSGRRAEIAQKIPVLGTETLTRN